MRKEIYSAFDSVHASRELKDRTRVFTARQLARRQASRPRSPRRWVAAAAAACLLLAAAGIGGHWLYFTPTAAISIDVNPSLELEVNRFDRVIGVEGYNEDGRALAALVDVTFQHYDQAVEEILNSETVTALLARDEVVIITVTGSDTAQCRRLLSGVEGETAGQPNVHCHSANHDQVEQAHEHGLSYGKYQAYLELRALDPDLTPEAVADMTMGEIRDLLRALSGQSPDSGQNGRGEGHHGQEHDQEGARETHAGQQGGAQGAGQGNGAQGGGNQGNGNGSQGAGGHRYGR